MISIDWTFPLPRVHTGVPLGNARLGVLAWGGGRTLRLTVARADWWDHRGGKPWRPEQSFARIRALLEANDAPGITALFANASTPGQPARPTLLPVGRFELTLPADHTLTRAALRVTEGETDLYASTLARGEYLLGTLAIAMDARPVALLELAADAPPLTFTAIPAWTHATVREPLAATGYAPPRLDAPAPDSCGWTQTTPADLAATARLTRVVHTCWLTVTLDPPAATSTADTLLTTTAAAGPAPFRAAARAWWHAYWQRVPALDHPHPRAAFLYSLGLYKFAGLTHPAGVAAGLQGPWIEDDHLPPWSGDYHFNINVQMCYWPAYQTGLWEHLLPLFDLVESWLPQLRTNARHFTELADGMLLPHAVDDRCHVIGNFWTGTIDHACTAWVGKMMFDHWLHTGDLARLRRVTFPYLVGAMRVYRAMLETTPDGALTLPISVSPEYRAAAMNAWGRDASFQLAACHWLAEALQTAAMALDEPLDPAWQDLRERLPRAALVSPAPDAPEIGLWQNLTLEESHRHHSHLAALCPFDTIDPHAPAWRDITWRSYLRWSRLGMGQWSGWCMPWAVMLHQRFDNAPAAELTLEIWERLFTNEGHGTLHDVAFPGFSTMGALRPGVAPAHELMQMDAGMAAVAAILDGLAHLRRGTLHLFTGVPLSRGPVSFLRLHLPGGWLADAARDATGATTLTLTATRRGTLAIAGHATPVTLAPGETTTLRLPYYQASIER